MANFLINFYNQTGAGPKNISLNFIQQSFVDTENKYYIIIPDIEEYNSLTSSGNVVLLKNKYYSSLIKKLFFRIKLDLFLIPNYVFKYNINSFLSFGNYLISPVQVYKVVLLHHPYLIDNNLLKKLVLQDKIIEKLKRVIFYFTIKNSDLIVVQSSYMKNMLNTVWNKNNMINNIEIIPNPISKNFSQIIDSNFISELIKQRTDKLSKNTTMKILYVSRFYPHKNHIFILSLARLAKSQKLNFEFYITVNPTLEGVTDLLETIRKEELNIINIGEINQNLLEKYYLDSDAFIFPSKAETFGNPLIEALRYCLPIIVPKLEYTEAILSEVGIYYEMDNTYDCLNQIKSIYEDELLYKQKSLQSINQFEAFPNAYEWQKLYIQLLAK